VATHYDVLGVAPTASYDEVRHAYLERARAVHPDRVVEGTASEAERRARTMQEVNEAWRVLRDPANRSAYDRALAGGGRPAAMQSGPSPWPPRHDPLDDEDDLDVPYRSALAQPGDLGVSMARALPWLALVAILVIIFVFTAFATGSGRNASGPHALVGRCITSGLGSAIDPVPCQGPNEGQVVLVVDRASLCPDGSTSRSVPGNVWLCLKPFIPMPTGPRTTASR
jgi:hypothetical protein